MFSATSNPTNIFLFKVTNENTRKMCEICSKSTVKTAKRHDANDAMVFLLLTLKVFQNFQRFFGDFEQVNVNWDFCRSKISLEQFTMHHN